MDEAGKVAINSKETIAALTYLKDLYATFVPGTLAWGDPSNNRAYAASEVLAHGQRRLALLRAEERSRHARPSPRTPSTSSLPFGVVGKPPQASLILNAHGVQAHQVPERRQEPTSSS